MDSFSTLPSLAEQLPRTKAASPDTWRTSAVLPPESIASLVWVEGLAIGRAGRKRVLSTLAASTMMVIFFVNRVLMSVDILGLSEAEC